MQVFDIEPFTQTTGDFHRAVGTKTGFPVWSFEVVDLPDGYEGCLPSDGLGVAFRAVDVTPVDVNASGRVSLDALSKVDGANFELKSNAKNRFMASKSASNMFNLTAEYGEQYPGSAKLFITDAGTSSGTPAPGHQTHNGSAFDVRYLDGSGNNVHSTNGAAIADCGSPKFNSRTSEALPVAMSRVILGDPRFGFRGLRSHSGLWPLDRHDPRLCEQGTAGPPRTRRCCQP